MAEKRLEYRPDEVTIEDERAYFLNAWQHTLQEVREEVEKELSAEADPAPREQKHRRHRWLVAS
ncbi:hypothetical protein [Paenarthrobacter nitroguajacolicus]|uniref:hypothetical protein n=1 Tax=Paenarthrobacter nitroguajacolicus TaxID=211146 RepID=UPI00285B43E2|nr:hypothetical protein [Paenarthrobacter nitroguajacolicus]MDR6639617.1 hypothetical protein [Paenarthrobacter nitroguajacolicus]